MKKIYLLIGLKGSGKSYAGKLMEKELGIEFLNVEEFFIKSLRDPDEFDEKENIKVWQKIENKIDERLLEIDQISLESVGVFDSFKKFLERLRERYQVKIIKIDVLPEVASKRIKERDSEKQIQLSEESIRKMSDLFSEENYEYDLVLDNENLSDEDLVKEIKKIL